MPSYTNRRIVGRKLFTAKAEVKTTTERVPSPTCLNSQQVQGSQQNRQHIPPLISHLIVNEVQHPRSVSSPLSLQSQSLVPEQQLPEPLAPEVNVYEVSQLSPPRQANSGSLTHQAASTVRRDNVLAQDVSAGKVIFSRSYPTPRRRRRYCC